MTREHAESCGMIECLQAAVKKSGLRSDVVERAELYFFPESKGNLLVSGQRSKPHIEIQMECLRYPISFKITQKVKEAYGFEVFVTEVKKI